MIRQLTEYELGGGRANDRTPLLTMVRWSSRALLFKNRCTVSDREDPSRSAFVSGLVVVAFGEVVSVWDRWLRQKTTLEMGHPSINGTSKEQRKRQTRRQSKEHTISHWIFRARGYK